MSSYQILRKGTVIKVINEDHQLYGKVALIDSIKSDDLYHIKMADGQEILLFAEEIEQWKGNEQQNKLQMG